MDVDPQPGPSSRPDQLPLFPSPPLSPEPPTHQILTAEERRSLFLNSRGRRGTIGRDQAPRYLPESNEILDIPQVNPINHQSTAAFVYEDTDSLEVEIAELFSYSEEREFSENVSAFETLLSSFDQPPSWRILEETEKQDTVLRLLDHLEVSEKSKRLQAARCLLYIAQGCWADLQLPDEQLHQMYSNVVLLYRAGAFSAFVDLLDVQIEEMRVQRNNFEELRVVLTLLYMMLEVMRQRSINKDRPPSDEDLDLFESLKTDLLADGDFLIVKLFRMLCSYTSCQTKYTNFPVKKVLLLLWKSILVTLGGIDKAEEVMRLKRTRSSLSPPRPKARKDSAGKVTKSDYRHFLKHCRTKYLEMSIPSSDETTFAGLPIAICQSLQTLKSHLYTPLGQVQIAHEKSLKTHPLTTSHLERMQEAQTTEAETITEELYRTMLPHFSSYLNALVKMLLLVLPRKDTKTRFYNPMQRQSQGDIRNPATSKIVLSIIYNVDMFRHEEIVIKSVSAILLLLLKHLKSNHVYQFELMCLNLVRSNMIPVLLRFLGQEISSHVKTVNDVDVLTFPSCVIGYQPEITIDCLSLTDKAGYSWRNMFASINILRILNKLTKWKHARIQILVSLESDCVFRRLVKGVANATFKFYVLKLIKMQMFYLGRVWRRNHLSVLTEMFNNRCIRLHLNDQFMSDSYYINLAENAVRAERSLERGINGFHKRKYWIYRDMDHVVQDEEWFDYRETGVQDPNFEHMFDSNDSCLVSMQLGTGYDMPKCFRMTYDLWIDQAILS